MNGTSQPHDILALDVGGVRIGVARANSVVRIAEPLTTLSNDEHVWQVITDLCLEHNVQQLVVGLPRGLDGQETAQTAVVRDFVAELSQRLATPIALQDEAVTSRQAEEELAERGKPFDKGDVDALAATYILEDYLHGSHGKM